MDDLSPQPEQPEQPEQLEHPGQRSSSRNRNLAGWGLLGLCTLAVGGLYAAHHLATAEAEPPTRPFTTIHEDPFDAALRAIPDRPISVAPPRNPFSDDSGEKAYPRAARLEDVENAFKQLSLSAVIEGESPQAYINRKVLHVGDAIPIPGAPDGRPAVSFTVIAMDERGVTLLVEEPASDVKVKKRLELKLY